VTGARRGGAPARAGPGLTRPPRLVSRHFTSLVAARARPRPRLTSLSRRRPPSLPLRCRPCVRSGVVLSGGSSLFPGLTERLQVRHVTQRNLTQRNESDRTQRNPTQRNATQRNATQRNATQRNATQRNATQRNATQRNATQRNAQPAQRNANATQRNCGRMQAAREADRDRGGTRGSGRRPRPRTRARADTCPARFSNVGRLPFKF
jgi:hypothetical protein